jgi:hypothetical protein
MTPQGVNNPDWLSEFRTSRWFTCGWTLQELLAPTRVDFFSIDGGQLGDKISLQNEISQTTRIPIHVIQGRSNLFQIDVQERMSWARDRQTKREEDAVYCLLGIFDVNLPLIYGKGERRAYRRLHKAILELSDDLLPSSFTDLSPNVYGPSSYAQTTEHRSLVSSGFTNPLVFTEGTPVSSRTFRDSRSRVQGSPFSRTFHWEDEAPRRVRPNPENSNLLTVVQLQPQTTMTHVSQGFSNARSQQGPLNNNTGNDSELSCWMIKKPSNSTTWADSEPARQHIPTIELKEELDRNRSRGHTIRQSLQEIPSPNARRIINELVEEQNVHLARENPSFRWGLAAISTKWRSVRDNSCG